MSVQQWSVARRVGLAASFATTCALWAVARPSAQLHFPGSPTPGEVVNVQPCEFGAVSRAAADARVSSLGDLMFEIARSTKPPLAGQRRLIWIETNARFDLSKVSTRERFALRIPRNVTLASGRSTTTAGGLLYFSQPLLQPRFMISMDGCTRITGLRLRGPSSSTETSEEKNVGIVVPGAERVDNTEIPEPVQIDNNEFYEWPGAGVVVWGAGSTYATARRVWIMRNFFHHNLACGAGYGVGVYAITGARQRGAYAFIDRNLFNYNRHAIAGDGTPATGYVAERNLVLSGGETCDNSWFPLSDHYNQHFDMHGFGGAREGYGGAGGEKVSIRYNTVRGEQSYQFINTRPVFSLRGTPSDVAEFYENVVAHDNQSDAIDIENDSAEARFRAWNNRYDVDTSNKLAVGDFDGDGFDDVFQATGTVWAFSSRGQSDWRIINSRPETLPRLMFGDFDGDGTTDVFTQKGGSWLVSYGGSTGWRPLPFGPAIDMSGYRVGDFDGDGKADIFRADGTRWWYSKGGATDWEPFAPFATSTHGVEYLRFGDFNGDGATDVFGIANNEWSVWYRGAASWDRLTNKIESNVAALVVADFNGDGVSDIARQNGMDYEVSWSGNSNWTSLYEDALRTQAWPLQSMLAADFNGNGGADLLHYRRTRGEGHGSVIIPGKNFVISLKGSQPFVNWSRYEMR